ncbi:hypothetical protein Dimus_035003 [Dionaea muscipula]
MWRFTEFREVSFSPLGFNDSYGLSPVSPRVGVLHSTFQPFGNRSQKRSHSIAGGATPSITGGATPSITTGGDVGRFSDIKPLIHDHSLFFDKLVELMPVKFYLPNDAQDKPWFQGLSKAAKVEAKQKSIDNTKVEARTPRSQEGL